MLSPTSEKRFAVAYVGKVEKGNGNLKYSPIHNDLSDGPVEVEGRKTNGSRESARILLIKRTEEMDLQKFALANPQSLPESYKTLQCQLSEFECICRTYKNMLKTIWKGYIEDFWHDED